MDQFVTPRLISDLSVLKGMKSVEEFRSFVNRSETHPRTIEELRSGEHTESIELWLDPYVNARQEPDLFVGDKRGSFRAKPISGLAPFFTVVQGEIFQSDF
jgi:hypothetical protein